MYGHTMDRTQRISKILNKINERFHRVFDWLTCEDLGRDWEGVANPYGNKCHIVGQDGSTGGQNSEFVKNS